MKDKDSKLLWEAYERESLLNKKRTITRFVDTKYAEAFREIFSFYITHMDDDVITGKVQFDLELPNFEHERAIDNWLYERGGGHI